MRLEESDFGLFWVVDVRKSKVTYPFMSNVKFIKLSLWNVSRDCGGKESRRCRLDSLLEETTNKIL